MPIWNGERFLSEAVGSILNQSFTDFELLAVDGGSTDRSLDMLANFNDPRIRIINAPPGLVPALNLGIKEAKGEWIARQDADDISHPKRLETQWVAVKRHLGTVFSHTDVELIGDNAASIGHARFPRSQAFLALKLCFQCGIVHSTAFFQRDAALALGGYQGEQAEDYGLWGRLIERGGVVGIPKKLLKFRMHGASASKRHAEMMEMAARQIGVEHCRRFMGLSSTEAERAHAILLTPAGARPGSEWSWFLRFCVPRLRWKSCEMYGWIAWQTLKTLVRRKQNITAIHVGNVT
jgi:glycosyltransferase involved in cell wall biosynthesis